ncbi:MULTISPECIES: MarR family winged helix-turn-helix transcriptional regulator [unclassified Cryobacterium]|uniref:MarR family winged helix-turn-helix transcriptional regulator n=1 Tax=unclassified Cryobacterium TaxID=2649013 RepID=UPI0014473937|nr:MULTISPECIES: MarR family transcriptional regulator [unclassified Cryobacterium]
MKPVAAQELRFAVQRLSRRIRIMQADGDVTEGQRSVLATIHNNGPQTLRSLAELEGVTPPSMNRTVNALVAAGLLEREVDEQDARRVILSISDAGADFIKETRKRRDAWFTKQLAGLSQDERDALSAATPVLKKLAEQ